MTDAHARDMVAAMADEINKELGSHVIGVTLPQYNRPSLTWSAVTIGDTLGVTTAEVEEYGLNTMSLMKGKLRATLFRMKAMIEDTLEKLE